MKQVVVTGASGEIGASLCKILKRDGFQPIILYHSNREKARKLANSVNASFFQCDVADKESVAKAAHAVKEKYTSIYGLINNAGIRQECSPIMELSPEQWNRILSVNLTGIFLCCRYFGPLIESDGRIVNIGSTISQTGLFGHGAYAVSKTAVDGLTKTLSRELWEKRITVNTLSPGPIEIDFRHYPEHMQLERKEIHKKMKEKTALKRLGKVEEIAEVMAFLISEKSSYITGQNIFVDGGF